MKRRLLQFCYWTPIAAAALIAILWLRSYFAWDVLRYGWNDGVSQVILSSVRGRLVVAFRDKYDRGGRGLRYLAESVVGTHAADYIQLYDGNTDTLAESLEFVQKTAATIIAAIAADESLAEAA